MELVFADIYSKEEFNIEYNYFPGRPARLNGHPDLWEPGESMQIDVTEVTGLETGVVLTMEEVKAFQAANGIRLNKALIESAELERSMDRDEFEIILRGERYAY